MQNFCLFCIKKKHVIFYFTHSLLQNTYISLSILYIYSIKYFKPNHHQPIQPPSSSQPHHQPTHQNSSDHQPNQYPWIKIIKTHSSKSSNSLIKTIGNGESTNQIIKTIGDQQRREQRRSVEKESVR